MNMYWFTESVSKDKRESFRKIQSNAPFLQLPTFIHIRIKISEAKLGTIFELTQNLYVLLMSQIVFIVQICSKLNIIAVMPEGEKLWVGASAVAW